MAHFKHFFFQHWFKLLLVGLLLFMLFKKDLSLHINMQAPASKPPSVEQTGDTREEVLTQAQASPNRQLFDFRLPSLGGGSAPSGLPHLEDEQAQAFVQRFARVAALERQKFGVPASITLANGLIQSHAGQSAGSTHWHNFFNTPCSDDWLGETGTTDGRCLRAYENAWTSFRDHSFYLTSGQWKAPADLAPTNYKAWSKHLGKGPYRQQKGYAKQLVHLIEKYELAKYDVD